MERPRLALLDASDEASTRRNFRRELDADLVEFDPNEGDLPDSFDSEERRSSGSRTPSDDFDGVVITGSRSSVYWDDPWIDPLVEWVAEAVEHDLPVLGVCYGHQVLAEALGGRVGRMDDYEIGYRTVEHLENDELFEGIAPEFTVFTTHSDTVTELPPGAKLVAENDYGVHAFRQGDAWGVQFHPEYDPETAREVAVGKDLPDERIERVLADINAENYAAACEAKQLFDNFTDYVREVAERDSDTEDASDPVTA